MTTNKRNFISKRSNIYVLFCCYVRKQKFTKLQFIVLNYDKKLSKNRSRVFYSFCINANEIIYASVFWVLPSICPLRKRRGRVYPKSPLPYTRTSPTCKSSSRGMTRRWRLPRARKFSSRTLDNPRIRLCELRREFQVRFAKSVPLLAYLE